LTRAGPAARINTQAARTVQHTAILLPRRATPDIPPVGAELTMVRPRQRGFILSRLGVHLPNPLLKHSQPLSASHVASEAGCWGTPTQQSRHLSAARRGCWLLLLRPLLLQLSTYPAQNRAQRQLDPSQSCRQQPCQSHHQSLRVAVHCRHGRRRGARPLGDHGRTWLGDHAVQQQWTAGRQHSVSTGGSCVVRPQVTGAPKPLAQPNPTSWQCQHQHQRRRTTHPAAVVPNVSTLSKSDGPRCSRGSKLRRWPPPSLVMQQGDGGVVVVVV
jgi:hypothetical protein